MSVWARRAGADRLGALVGIALLAAAPATRAAGEPPPPAAAVAPLPSPGAVAPVPANGATPDSAGIEGLTIGRVDIVTREIFDPATGDPMAGFYRLANLLHVRTREFTVRRQLLFATGEPWSQSRADETARALRSLDYLEPRRLAARREGDSVVVEVETRDSWTTSPVLNVERGGGTLYGTVGLTERNLLGFGKQLSFLYNEDPSGITRSLSYRDPHVFGSRVQFQYAAATGTSGSADLVSLAHPFYAQETRDSYGFTWRRSSSLVNLYEAGSEVAEFGLRHHESELWAGRGRKRDGTILRTTGSLFLLERHLGPSLLEPGAPPDFAGGEEDLDLRRMAVDVSLWRPNYIVREDLERIGRKEDYDIGWALGAKVGYSPELFGSTANEGYVRLAADGGAAAPFGFGYARSSISMRLRRGPLEIIRRLDARWYLGRRPGRALVLSALGVGGTEVSRDFQVVVGGLNGLRAYSVQALAGRELVRLNAEQRVVLFRNRWDLLSLGGAAFYDAARAWGPGAVGTGWFHAAGFGMRFATPRGSFGPVLRVDVAWPISPTRDGAREAVITFGSSQAF